MSFFSLQKGKAGELSAGGTLNDACRSCNDFADTVALIETLDLVIAVDTAVAHMAGALGKDLWVLLSDLSDWRWMEDREDSPWYASARLFRQRVAGYWDESLRASGTGAQSVVPVGSDARSASHRVTTWKLA